MHVDAESLKIRDCAWYDRGFCKHGRYLIFLRYFLSYYLLQDLIAVTDIPGEFSAKIISVVFVPRVQSVTLSSTCLCNFV